MGYDSYLLTKSSFSLSLEALKSAPFSTSLLSCPLEWVKLVATHHGLLGQQHAVVWDRPVIQKIQVRFPDGAVCCCYFLEQELYPHCSSRPSCIIGECEATPVVGFLEQETSLHCSSLPSCNGYLAVLALAGEGKSWTRMKTYLT